MDYPIPGDVPCEDSIDTIADIFAPRHLAGSPGERLRMHRPLEGCALTQWWQRRQAAGAKTDALFAAAWHLLKSRWTGVVLPSADAGAWVDDFFAGQPMGRECDVISIPAPSSGPHGPGLALRVWLEESTSTGCGTLQLDAGTEWLDAAAGEQLLAAIADTAADLLERPGSPVGTIRTLTAADRETQLQRWNQPPGEWDAGATVHGVFSRMAAQHPARVAVEESTEQISYGELERRSELLARRLRACGVQPGDCVGMMLDRSINAVLALLGILKTGAAYVPLPSDYPAERIAHMLEHSGARLVVCLASHRSSLPSGMALFAMDAPEPPEALYATLEPAAADGHSLAYVMYTSGSTGVPKGIEICHRSILRLVIDANYIDLAVGAGMLHGAPLAFDASTLEIWGPLLTGGRCIVHPETLPTTRGLAQAIARHDVETAWLTASLFNALVDADPLCLAGLRQLLIGGEALSLPHVNRFMRALPHAALYNGYGPTECTTFAAVYRIPAALPENLHSVPLGHAVNDTVLRVLSPSLAMLPSGFVGELCIGGRGLARGYLRQPGLTAERFIADPYGAATDRLYRTGDLARWLPDGTIEFVGRMDHQVKLNGHRVEPGEVQAALLAHPAIRSCAVVARADGNGRLGLIAYLVASGEALSWSVLRAHLASRLPKAMQPSAHVWLSQLPVTANGKLDHRALPDPPRERPSLAQPFEEPRSEAERLVCEAFAKVLDIDQVGRNDNFFDLGGDSLRVLKVIAQLQAVGGRRLSTNLFFRDPTPCAMAVQLDDPADEGRAARRRRPTAARKTAETQEPVAIIGMAGRFPGAHDIEHFWANLMAGRDSISFFDDDTLDAGISAALRADPAYVKARGVLDGIEDFDAAFFGMNPREAQLMDPQQRVFLEICWECLERAGYVPDQAPGPVGIYAGMHNATYFQRHVSSHPELVQAVGDFQVMLGNEKDYVSTRVANRLNLTGPAISLNTACSTSLVAVAQAFHALRTGQCRMALAGGVSITCPPRSGYLYEEGSMLSPDGHTRSFSAEARGTVFSDGATVVLLKRLSDAQADGDTIHAVLRGVGVNNDGGAKASFTAPSVDGQAAVIRAALASAGIGARSISYVEAHGTATPMGDPVEVEALTTAFSEHTGDFGFCTLGSVKSNVGHMVTAAGVAGLIKTALALDKGWLPPTAHFTKANPAISFAHTPFRVSNELLVWPRGTTPRRAGVSSFGVGGTNAHVILEEAPPPAEPEHVAGSQLLLLSARSEAALDIVTAQLADCLLAQPDICLADVAYTLAQGRKAHTHRLAVVAADVAEAAAGLRSAESRWRTKGTVGARPPQAVLAFPGQGAQYAGMGQDLYAHNAVFSAAFDECLAAFEGILDFDLRERMFSADPAALAATFVTQPATFVLEYALARSLMSAGVTPVAFIGHSVGEFVAAVLAGVMRTADAARLVARRGALMQSLPPGAMLSVRLSAATLVPRLEGSLSLAAENAPRACVVAGPTDAVERLRAALATEGVDSRTLQTSHAFHSAMMDAAVAPFEQLVRQVPLQPPLVPIFSTLSGRLLTDAEATSPGYWARHLRETVRFSAAVDAAVAELPHAVFVEVGPRNTLATLIRQHPGKAGGTPPLAVSLMSDDPRQECRAFSLATGRLWTLGTAMDLSSLDTRHRKLRTLLPTTPFERKRCWVDIRPEPELATSRPHLLVVGGRPPGIPIAPLAPATPPIPAIPTAIASPSSSSSSSSFSFSSPSPSLPREPSMTAIAHKPAHDLAPVAALSARLRELFEDISGIDMAQAPGYLAFGELGLDSLTLTQAATQIKKTLKVSISFRQLMEDHRTFDSLALHLQSLLPAEPSLPTAPLLAIPVGPTPAYPQPAFETGKDGLPQLLLQQMHLMQQLSQMLVSGSVVATPAAPPEPVISVAASPVAEVPIKYDVAKAFGAIARIHTKESHGGRLTVRQDARLAAFMRRYVDRTRRSKAFTAHNRAHMADPRVVNGFRPVTKEITYQIVVDRSKGSRMWDIDGNEYVDVLSGFGMNMFGWQPDFVLNAVREQLDNGYEIGPQHPLAAEVTQLVCELTGFDRAALCNTGSEAVMAALRIARTVTGRSMVAVFAGSYHGTFDEVLVRAGRGGKGIPAAPGVMSGMFGDIHVLEYGTPEALTFIRNHVQELAAVLVEPIQSRRPDFQPREFLQAVREVTAASGSCLIFDEVITGFRASLGGAQALLGVRADLATYGKVIGGGFPVGVIAGKREFMDALDGGAWDYGDASIPSVGVTYFAGTFVRHPLALAAARASLLHLKACGPALQEKLNAHTAALADELTAFCAQVGAPLAIRHFSSLWRISWLEDHPLQDLLFAMMRSRGVHILDNFPCFLTTAHSDEDIAIIKMALKESVAEMQETGFLPRRWPVLDGYDLGGPPDPDADGSQPGWYAPAGLDQTVIVKAQS